MEKNRQPQGSGVLATPAARGMLVTDPDYWRALASTPSPAELAALRSALNAGHDINLFLRLVYFGCRSGRATFEISRSNRSIVLRVLPPHLSAQIRN